MIATQDVLTAPFVKSEAGALESVLVVRPTPALRSEVPVQGESSPILERAAEQHYVLIARLKALGVATAVLDHAADVPFGASLDDTAVLFADGAFLMRPSDLGRRREVTIVEQLLNDARIPVIGRIEAPGLLDGGDVIVGEEVVFVGAASDRSAQVGVPKPAHGNAHGRAQLAAFAAARGLKALEVPYSATVRRLRAVASLVDHELVLYAPAVVDGAAFAKMQTVEVPAGEDYGAGVLVLGNRRVIANVRFRTVQPLLCKAKITVDAIDLWEFGKVGVTPSSMVLALKRS